jgi:predicted transcriptional regulator
MGNDAGKQAAALRQQKNEIQTAALQAEALRNRIRITLDVTPPMKSVLDRLAEQEGTTQSEILRRAIALLNAVKTAESKGEGEAALVKDGQLVAKLVGF